MKPSSRTPEGWPNRCPVCGKEVHIEPSIPPGDAPCPHCGHLLWFEPQEQNIDEGESATQESGVRELVELAQQRFDEDELSNQDARLRQGEFTLVDFKKLMGQTKKLGPLNKILSMLPGMGRISQTLAEADTDEDMRRLTGIIDAMTPEERRNPKEIIDASRRRRVAKGAGVMPSDVSILVEQFAPMAEMMNKMSGMGMRERVRLMEKFQQGDMLPKGIGPGKRLTPEERARLNKRRRGEDSV